MNVVQFLQVSFSAETQSITFLKKSLNLGMSLFQQLNNILNPTTVLPKKVVCNLGGI
jgi:hypothetical protein